MALLVLQGTGGAHRPNMMHGEHVREAASLIGMRRFAGDGIPSSLKFELDQRADFMPKTSSN